MGKKWGNKVWEKCEKPKSGKNVKNSRGKIWEKNVEKNWRRKNVDKRGKMSAWKKAWQFPWKNITYLVVLWSRIFLLCSAWINILTSLSPMQLHILWCEYLTMDLKLESNLLLMLDGHKSWALGHWLDVYNKQDSRSVISTQSFSSMKGPTNDVSKPFALYFVSCLALVFLLNHRAHLLGKQLFLQLRPKNHGTFDFYAILFIDVSSCGWTFKLS